TWLGWPDGLVADHEADVAADLARALAAGREGTRTVVLAPWVHDPHPDHQAVGRAAGAAARRAGLDPWSYPV
ncbi:MAG: PIG-L family deacetylase, partial [Actinomycetota bacterium]|nr:PIG-L family deacetylase [Actinomycetota bacterium]